jgi:hypothetical protein
MSANYLIFSFLVWLLVGREDLESGKIESGKIGNNEIEDSEEDIGIADCEKFFFNYINRCAVSIHSANLIIDKAAIETANTY